MVNVEDPRFLPKSPGESWILDLGSTIFKFNMDSIFRYGRHSRHDHEMLVSKKEYEKSSKEIKTTQIFGGVPYIYMYVCMYVCMYRL